MKRSLMAIALMACASLAVACYETVMAPFRLVATMLKEFALSGLKLVGGGSRCIDLNPVSLRVQAKAYAIRLDKRERPVLTASWRMCPSG